MQVLEQKRKAKALLHRSSAPIGKLINFRFGVWRVLKHGRSCDSLPGGMGVREMELEFHSKGSRTAQELQALNSE